MYMNLPRLIVIPALCLLIGIGLLVSYFATQSFSSVAVRPPDNPIKEIDGYRGWPKVNTQPQLMPDRTAALCAPVFDALFDNGRNPHRHKYVTVYVNDIGRQAMLEQIRPAFPEGSVIVKEKLPEKSSQTPELLTVMIKHGKGFNPTSGDWEYMVVDGTGTTVQARGKLENCQSCHSARPKTDYVFRTYLSNEAMNKLK
jgi:hypothetical protein